MWPELNIFPHHGSPGSATSNGRHGRGAQLRHKKCVRIVESFNQLHFIDSRTTMTREEHRSCFFSDAEYAAMRQRDNELSRNLDDARDLVVPEIGLESRRDKNKRRRRMDECLMSVMLEQELRELDRDPIDPLFLARLVLGYSSHSTKLAHSRARENEVQVFGGRRGPPEHVLPGRSVSPTTPKEELGNRYTHQLQQRKGKQQRHPSSPDAFFQTTKTKPEGNNRSTDVKMAAEFDPPHQSLPPMERFPQLAPRLSPFHPRTTYSFVEATSSFTSPRGVSSSSPSPSPATSRSYSFVLPPFPAWEEEEHCAIPAASSAQPSMMMTKARTTLAWYEDFVDDRWM
jgi:hypothetical protein